MLTNAVRSTLGYCNMFIFFYQLKTLDMKLQDQWSWLVPGCYVLQISFSTNKSFDKQLILRGTGIIHEESEVLY